ncbi:MULTISPECIES: TetR/AcrR family transcriptional regulator [unclassified Nocardia]|uniref:TetR/AcrR family transcriptional regulator n=1 Tax=unclassified Nocardia TaxID=2637762 RepID=UPI001CE41006|nr:MULTISPECIES: TetR/AcrR family transcriptional regulator [unclassified Nocardia]
MTANPPAPPRGARAEANRTRILTVAAAELARDPAASMEEIAAAAGVVRRTIYGHFPNREALIDGVLDHAADEINNAFDQTYRAEPPAVTSARFTIALLNAGDKYRLLLRLTETNLRPRILDRLAPMRAYGVRLLKAGQQEGAFSDHLPPETLARVLEAILLSLVDARNDESWIDPHPAKAGARACLIAAGVAPSDAAAIIDAIDD